METGERTSTVVLVRLALRGSLTVTVSSSELMFSIPSPPPDPLWPEMCPSLQVGGWGGRGGGAACSRGGRGGAVMSLGGRGGGGGEQGTGGWQWVAVATVVCSLDLKTSGGLKMDPVPCFMEAIPESRLEGVQGVGEGRAEAGEESRRLGVGVVDVLPSRLREENG